MYSRVGGADRPFVATVFSDITECKQEDARQAFLLELGDVLRAQPNEQAIKEQAVKMLAEYLRLKSWFALPSQ